MVTSPYKYYYVSLQYDQLFLLENKSGQLSTIIAQIGAALGLLLSFNAITKEVILKKFEHQQGLDTQKCELNYQIGKYTQNYNLSNNHSIGTNIKPGINSTYDTISLA